MLKITLYKTSEVSCGHIPETSEINALTFGSEIIVRRKEDDCDDDIDLGWEAPDIEDLFPAFGSSSLMYLGRDPMGNLICGMCVDVPRGHSTSILPGSRIIETHRDTYSYFLTVTPECVLGVDNDCSLEDFKYHVSLEDNGIFQEGKILHKKSNAIFTMNKDVRSEGGSYDYHTNNDLFSFENETAVVSAYGNIKEATIKRKLKCLWQEVGRSYKDFSLLLHAYEIARKDDGVNYPDIFNTYREIIPDTICSLVEHFVNFKPKTFARKSCETYDVVVSDDRRRASIRQETKCLAELVFDESRLICTLTIKNEAIGYIHWPVPYQATLGHQITKALGIGDIRLYPADSAVPDDLFPTFFAPGYPYIQLCPRDFIITILVGADGKHQITEVEFNEPECCPEVQSQYPRYITLFKDGKHTYETRERAPIARS